MNPMVFQVATMALGALADGKVTGREVTEMFFTFLKLNGIDVSGEFHDIFMEQDGDVHVILSRKLLDKLNFEV